jgi:hypothetical protein
MLHEQGHDDHRILTALAFVNSDSPGE